MSWHLWYGYAAIAGAAGTTVAAVNTAAAARGTPDHSLHRILTFVLSACGTAVSLTGLRTCPGHTMLAPQLDDWPKVDRWR
jgi:hypothetical protein